MHTSPSPISTLHQAPGFSLSYRVRAPAPSSPKACAILLHGVGGNETNLAELASAIDPSVLVVLPRGPIPLGPDQYAWFRVAFTQNGPRLDPAEANRARETLLAFISEIEAAYQLDSGRVVIAGFSQGGIMSASVALSEPERVLGFGILSGRILPELTPYLAGRERLGTVQAFIGHGELDDVLPLSWAQRSEHRLSELGVAYDSRRYAAGHMLTPAMQGDFLAWCGKLFGTHFSRQGQQMSANSLAVEPQTRRAMHLDLGRDRLGVRISDAAHAPRVDTIDIGVESIALAWFKHEPPTAIELESAIQVIEDGLEAWRSLAATDLRLLTQDKGILEIAQLAAVPLQTETVLSREAVEQTFGRLAAVAQGRPASTEGLPASRLFAARLVILREFMHHLKFDSITIEARTCAAPPPPTLLPPLARHSPIMRRRSSGRWRCSSGAGSS